MALVKEIYNKVKRDVFQGVLSNFLQVCHFPDENAEEYPQLLQYRDITVLIYDSVYNSYVTPSICQQISDPTSNISNYKNTQLKSPGWLLPNRK